MGARPTVEEHGGKLDQGEKQWHASLKLSVTDATAVPWSIHLYAPGPRDTGVARGCLLGGLSYCGLSVELVTLHRLLRAFRWLS